MTELEKMKAGKLFNQTDRSLLLKMARTYCLVWKLNRTSLLNQPKRNRLLKKILGGISGKPYYVQSPFYIDYGFNTFIGANFLSNYNLVIMDEGEVHIGDDVMIGPNVSIITNLHSKIAEARKICHVPNYFPHNHKGNYIYSKPIHIGNCVWICTGVVICPGVTIGDGAIIGAGSVVTQDIPPYTIAYGVPCRPVRAITDKDRIEGSVIYSDDSLVTK